MTAGADLDLDGTLTDAAPVTTRSIEAALPGLGMPSSWAAALRGMVGPPLQDNFPVLGVPAGQVDEAIALHRARCTTAGLFANGVYDGVPEMTEALRNQGWRLAPATSKPIAFAAKITSRYGLDAWLDDQFESELDGTRADKPSLPAHAMARTCAQAERWFMLGDGRHDAAGARANGLRALGALWGNDAREGLEAPARAPEQAGEAR